MPTLSYVDADAELFVIYDDKDKRWIPCLDDLGAECSLGRKSIDEDTVITPSEGWTLNEWFAQPICYSFLCFEYVDSTARVTEGTMAVLDYYRTLTEPHENATIVYNATTPFTDDYLQKIIHGSVELDCTDSDALFIVNGADLVTQDQG